MFCKHPFILVVLEDMNIVVSQAALQAKKFSVYLCIPSSHHFLDHLRAWDAIGNNFMENEVMGLWRLQIIRHVFSILGFGVFWLYYEKPHLCVIHFVPCVLSVLIHAVLRCWTATSTVFTCWGRLCFVKCAWGVFTWWWIIARVFTPGTSWRAHPAVMPNLS